MSRRLGVIMPLLDLLPAHKNQCSGPLKPISLKYIFGYVSAGFWALKPIGS